MRDGRRWEEKTKACPIDRIEANRPHRLACRLEGTRAVVQLDGRDLLMADGVGPAAKGHVGLAAEGIRAELSELTIEAARPEYFDPFDTLDAWRPCYGPSAWRVEADAARPGNRVALFSAAADGAIVGGPEGSHFAAEVKGKFLDASNTWACFGLRPKFSDRGCYVFEVRGKLSRLSVWKQWQGRRDPVVAREVPLGRIETGRWYTLRCELVGDSIRASFDGRRVLDLVDPRPIPAGRTAISASYGTVQLDDFRQEEIPSHYSFATAEQPAEPYDPGPALEAVSPSGPDDAAYWYLDNDGTGAQVIDWDRLRLDQDYDWQRFHEGLLAAARARNPQTATFFNFDVQPLGLVPGRPYFTWLFELTDPRDHRGRLSERQQREAYEQSHWGEEIVVSGRLLEHGPRLPERYGCRVIAYRRRPGPACTS